MSKNELQKAPTDLIAIAIEKGASLETLNGLMDLQERWEKKEAIKSFKNAMANFQSEKPELKKESSVDYTFGGKRTFYRFSSLSSIQKLIDPILSKYGISYRWEQNEKEVEIIITCIVSHADGHEEKTHITAPRDSSGSKNTVQSIGSTISYLKRYTLTAALGLSSDEDNDAVMPPALDDPLKLDKEELTPDHKSWKVAKASLENGSFSMVQIKAKYRLSKENETLLKTK